MTEQLIPPRSLFRISVPCLRRKPLVPDAGEELEPQFALPPLAELDQQPAFGDVRAAWNDEGLCFSVRVSGKRRLPRCDARRLDESDRFELWIDTRDTHTIHRAGRFCHRFIFLPVGGGARRDQPVAALAAIDRARESPRPAPPGSIEIHAERRVDGYLLVVQLREAALTGFDPAEHPRLGFNYAVTDHELGLQCFSSGPPLPYGSDPSVWATLELRRA